MAGTDESARRNRESLARIDISIAKNESSRLAEVKGVFRISKEETDLLEACLAVALDPSLARVCAYLQDHTGRAYVTEDLAARLFGYGRSSVWSAESPLFRWELIFARDMGPGGASGSLMRSIYPRLGGRQKFAGRFAGRRCPSLRAEIAAAVVACQRECRFY